LTLLKFDTLVSCGLAEAAKRLKPTFSEIQIGRGLSDFAEISYRFRPYGPAVQVLAIKADNNWRGRASSSGNASLTAACSSRENLCNFLKELVAVFCSRENESVGDLAYSRSAVTHINEVTLRQARLVRRWVTVSGFNFWCETVISVRDRPPRSTQPGHPFVGRRNEYQPKSGDALRLGS